MQVSSHCTQVKHKANDDNIEYPVKFLLQKKDKVSYRIIHDFGPELTAQHISCLHQLRKILKEQQDDVFSNKFQMQKCVFGNPYGNNNMKQMIRAFCVSNKQLPHWSQISFDIQDFYHSITPDHVLKLGPEIFQLARPAFVDLGSGLLYLAQGSPLSQDIANLVLSDFDRKMITTCSRISSPFLERFLEKRTMTYQKRSKRALSRFSPYFDNILRVRAQHILNQNPVFEIKYIRYIDNFYIRVYYKDHDAGPQIAEIIKKYLSKYIMHLLGFMDMRINGKKTHIVHSRANRRAIVLGLNTTHHVQCKKRYIDSVRAQLKNEVMGIISGNQKDLSRECIGKMVHIVSSRYSSIRRLSSSLDRLYSFLDQNPSQPVPFARSMRRYLTFILRQHHKDSHGTLGKQVSFPSSQEHIPADTSHITQEDDLSASGQTLAQWLYELNHDTSNIAQPN